MRHALFLLVSLLPLTASAVDLNGMWELQAIGQDGTQVQIEQKDDAVMLYRVMYPEFEGQKYKLEHLYKGRIIGGKTISGTLLVRDDPKGEFEPLRPFDGQVQNDKYIVVDDLPLRLSKPGVQPLPVQPPEPKRKKRGSDAPPLSESNQSADAQLAQNILGAPGGSLFQISARIRLPSPADDYEHLGEEKVKEKKIDEAIDAYEKVVEIDPKRLEVYATLGRLCADTKQFADAKKYLAEALRVDPHNKVLKREYEKVNKAG